MARAGTLLLVLVAAGAGCTPTDGEGDVGGAAELAVTFDASAVDARLDGGGGDAAAIDRIDLAVRDLPTTGDGGGDLSVTEDLPAPQDFAAVEDLALPVDLVVLDLSASVDLPAPDLAPRPDQRAPADLLPPPDLRTVDLITPPSCRDKVQNGDETDVDCGGSCPRCPAKARCLARCDCQTNWCFNGTCHDVDPRCQDGIKNNFETDVDCGGIGIDTCPQCPDKKRCTECLDCASRACIAGVCDTPGPVGNAVIGDPAPCLGGGSVLHVEGEVGDTVWPGVLTLADPNWSLNLQRPECGPPNFLYFYLKTDNAHGTFWGVRFGAHNICRPLDVGTWELAERADFASPGHPGLDVYNVKGCNNVTGRFQIQELTMDGPAVKRFTATFEQHCEGRPPVLSGCMHYER